MGKICLTIAVAVSVVLSAAQSLKKPFWHDELLTLYVRNLGTPLEQWRALMRGADGMPPAFYWMTSLPAALPINPHLAYRLPALAGWCLALICVYLFISRRLGAVSGLCGALLLALSPVAMYASEARPYGLLLGLTALAAVCWQRLEDGNRWAVLLAVSLFLLTSIHYLSPLIVLCFAEAELFRSLLLRTVRRTAWAAFTIAAIPSILTSQILLGMHREIGHTFWSKPHWSDVPSYWGASLNVTQGTIAIVLPICFLLLLRDIYLSHGSSQPLGATSQSERILSVTLLLLPLQGFLLAISVDGGFHPRYVVAFVIGACFALLLLMERFSQSTLKFIAACLFLAFVVPGAYRIAANRGPSAEEQGRSLPVLSALARIPDSTLPMVVLDEIQYLEAVYYGGRSAAARLYYLGHKETFSRFGLDSHDLPSRIRPISESHSLTIADFIRDHSAFVVLANSKLSLNWVPDYLCQHGWSLEFQSAISGNILYRAIPPVHAEVSVN